MKRWILGVAAMAIFCCLAAATTTFQIQHTLKLMEGRQPALCLTERDKAKITSGRFSTHQQDIFVVAAINYEYGVSKSLRWALRGGAIQMIYSTFWSDRAREEQFTRLTSIMRNCPMSNRAEALH